MRSIVVALAAVLVAGFALGDFERGNRLYREGSYREAVEAYRAALDGGRDSPALHYNLGTALLRLGRYKRAERHFRAALESVDPELRQRAYYNLGNRYLRAARRGKASARASAKLLDAAVRAYKRALRLDPSDRAAKWNYELALRERKQRRRSRRGGQRPRPQPGAQRRPAPPRAGQRPTPNQPPRAARSERRRRRGGARGRMTRRRARRILRAVAQGERSLLRKKLDQRKPEVPVARDW